MKISGKGNIDGGVYNEDIYVIGMAQISGAIKCTGVSVSGTLKSDGEIDCEGAFLASGFVSAKGSVSAREIKVSGTATFSGGAASLGKLDVNGKLSCGGGVKCESLTVSGEAEIKGEVEADSVYLFGNVDCDGLINADTVEIHPARSGNRVLSIGGGVITVFPDKVAAFVNKTPLLTKLVGGNVGVLSVEEGIEGDEITLEFVKCPSVSGRVIKIGKGCEIGHVKYSESIDVSSDATVTYMEKV